MSPISKQERKNISESIDDIINDKQIKELVNVEEFVIGKEWEKVAAVIVVDELKRLQDLINKMNNIIENRAGRNIIEEMKK